jgi:hypothetical protein
LQLAQQIERQLSLANWIDEQLRVELPINSRSYLSIGCFDLAIEHHAAMLTLAQSELYGSMLALIRVEFETVARGLWLRYCATDAELKRFEKKGTIDLKFGLLLKRVESAVGVPDGPLSTLKKKSWGLMNSLTHTGIEQVHSRHAPGTTGGNYSPEGVTSALELSGTLALCAAVELASYTGRDDLIKQVLDRARQYSADVA